MRDFMPQMSKLSQLESSEKAMTMLSCAHVLHNSNAFGIQCLRNYERHGTVCITDPLQPVSTV